MPKRKTKLPDSSNVMRSRLDNIILYIMERQSGVFISILENLNNSQNIDSKIEQLPTPYKEVLFAFFCLKSLSEDSEVEAIDNAIKVGLWLLDVQAWCIVDKCSRGLQNFADQSFELHDKQRKKIDDLRNTQVLDRILPKLTKGWNAAKRKGTLLSLRKTVNRLCDKLGYATVLASLSNANNEDVEDNGKCENAREEIAQETANTDNPYNITIAVDDFNDDTRVLSYYSKDKGSKSVKFHTIQSYVSKYKINLTVS